MPGQGGAVPHTSTDCGMDGLGAALQKRTWGYGWVTDGT